MNKSNDPFRPTGAYLLDLSTARPVGDIKFPTSNKPVSEGHTSADYLQRTHENDPWPEEDKTKQPQVTLANCRFLTPTDQIWLNEPVEVAVDVTKTGTPTTKRAFFTVYYTELEGKKERIKGPSNVEAFVDKEDGSGLAKVKFPLELRNDVKRGGAVKLELEATHAEASGTCVGPALELTLRTLAHWVGGNDIHYRTGGEFPLMGKDSNLVQVLAAAVQRSQKPPTKNGETMVCLGYASSDGKVDANRALSERRAKGIKALLDRDDKNWSELAKGNFETIDIQQFLSDLHVAGSWECDPGSVDGQNGPKTKAAIQSFQREANSRYKLGLKEDGVCGPKTWAATMRAILGQVQAALGEGDLAEPAWPAPKWGNQGKGIYGCGEDFATGGDNADERAVQIAFFGPGCEPIFKDAAKGQKATLQDAPVQNPKVVEKRKIGTKPAEPKAPRKEVVGDKVVVLDVTGDRVAVMDKAAYDELNREAALMEKVSKVIGPILFPDIKRDKSGEDDKIRESRVKAAYDYIKKLSAIEDIAESEKYVAKIQVEIESLTKKHLQNAYSNEDLRVKGGDLESGWTQKLYYVPTAGKKIWCRGKKKKVDTRWYGRKTIKKDMEREVQKEKEENKGGKFDKERELKLIEVDLFDTQEGTWAPGVEKFFHDRGMQELLKDSRHFDAGIEAQTLRWAAEGKFGSTIDWSKTKTIKAEAKVDGSFNLLSSKGNFSVYIPDKDGIDIIKLIRAAFPLIVQPDAKPIYLQAMLKLEGSAFVGVNVSATAGIGIGMQPSKKKEAAVEVGFDAFAGAKAGAEGALLVQMKLVSASSTMAEWKELGDLTYGGWVALGFGATFDFKIGFYNKRFQYQFKAGLVFKGGLGGYYKGNLDVEQFCKLAWSLGTATNWSKLSHFMSEEAWDLYQGIMFQAAMTADSFERATEKFILAMNKASDQVITTALGGFQQLKNADDFGDQYIPGYSGFKHYTRPFIVLKSTYTSLKELASENTPKAKATAAVQAIERTKRWQFITGEMKENLIADLYGKGPGNYGPLSDEPQEEAIIVVLRSSRNKKEFHDIITKLRKERGVALDTMLDYSQKDQFNELQNRFR